MLWSNHASQYIAYLWRHSHVGCAVVSTDGHIIDANQHFASVLGYTTNELQNTHVDAITEYSFRGTGSRELAEVAKGRVSYYSQRKQYLAKNQKPIWAEAKSFPIRIEGKIDHFFSVVVFDGECTNSEIEDVQEQLDRHQKLIEAIVGSKGKTTVITGKGNAGGSISSSSNNDAKVLIAVAFALCVAVISIAVVALGGSFTATDGEQSIEVQGD